MSDVIFSKCSEEIGILHPRKILRRYLAKAEFFDHAINVLLSQQCETMVSICRTYANVTARQPKPVNKYINIYIYI